jgi:hypothetical protein
MIKIKKSQAWGFDLLIAITIFLAGVIIFLVYSINFTNETEENFESMERDAEFIAESVFSSGYPMDWNDSNVQSIGIYDSGKINNSKLEKFYDLGEARYNFTKTLFKTKYDYFIGFEGNMSIRGAIKEGIGYSSVFLTEKINNVSNLIKITRFIVYNNKPVNAYIYVWD